MELSSLFILELQVMRVLKFWPLVGMLLMYTGCRKDGVPYSRTLKVVIDYASPTQPLRCVVRNGSDTTQVLDYIYSDTTVKMRIQNRGDLEWRTYFRKAGAVEAYKCLDSSADLLQLREFSYAAAGYCDTIKYYRKDVSVGSFRLYWVQVFRPEPNGDFKSFIQDQSCYSSFKFSEQKATYSMRYLTNPFEGNLMSNLVSRQGFTCLVDDFKEIEYQVEGDFVTRMIETRVSYTDFNGIQEYRTATRYEIAYRKI